MSDTEKELRKFFTSKPNKKYTRRSYTKSAIRKDLERMGKILRAEGRFDDSGESNSN